MTNEEFLNDMCDRINEEDARFTETRKDSEDPNFTLEELKRFISLLSEADDDERVDILNCLNNLYNIFGDADCDETLYTVSDWGESDEASWVGISEIYSGSFLDDDEIRDIIAKCNDMDCDDDIAEYLADYFDGYLIPYDDAHWYDKEIGGEAVSRDDM